MKWNIAWNRVMDDSGLWLTRFMPNGQANLYELVVNHIPWEVKYNGNMSPAKPDVGIRV